ncbi:hypothetical protein BCF74_11225 [Knoellia remsis]|uniref:HTH luxR-type domain-containing protein n=1 Tax=Knoellia remsis TaxID=407159 RepID=A0A2T0UK32_9MICO|nr:hypothetical protein [Knoellia remsis]PRY58208.1 hypothetical protein BCF74_11225 [Knoellia remsis]
MPSVDTMSPARMLEEYIDREDARIEERLRDLRQVRGLIETLTPGETVQREGVEPIADDIAPTVVQRLIHEASGVLRTLIMALDTGPGVDEATVRDNKQWMAEGNEQRAIYPAGALDAPPSLQWLRSWASIGEQQRLLPTVATEFAVFGTTGAVALAKWGDLSSGYVLVRDPLLIAGLTAYFDLAWEHAHAVPFAASLPGDERLVELLGMGLKDEAIARFLGIGLRTVRRRIAALMAVHGVDTRFQLGVAIAEQRLSNAQSANGHRRPQATVGTRHTR